MMTKAIILFAFIILFAVLSFASFISTVIGLVTKRKKLWIVSLAVCLSSVGLLSLTTIYSGQKAVNKISAIIAPGPDVTFARGAGLEWPESAEIITTGGEFFVFDSEFYMVFKADHEVLETWLSGAPPWGMQEWQAGPIPSKIPSGINEPDIHISDSKTAWYVVKEYCCEDLAFHSGDLLIIDLETNTVLWKSWQY